MMEIAAMVILQEAKSVWTGCSGTSEKQTKETTLG